MSKESEITLVTFPRSGSFFLNNLLTANFSVQVHKTHIPELSRDKMIVTIARHPESTIASYLAMLSEYRDDLDHEATALQLLLDYEENYKYFNDYAKVVVDFHSLTFYPEQTLLSISQQLRLGSPKVLNTNVGQKDLVGLQHLSSSKKSEHYKKALAVCSGLDFSNAIMLFKELQRKSCNANQ